MQSFTACWMVVILIQCAPLSAFLLYARHPAQFQEQNNKGKLPSLPLSSGTGSNVLFGVDMSWFDLCLACCPHSSMMLGELHFGSLSLDHLHILCPSFHFLSLYTSGPHPAGISCIRLHCETFPSQNLPACGPSRPLHPATLNMASGI